MFSHPWQIGISAYLIIGAIVVGVVSVRGMKLRRPPNNGLLWEQRDNTRNPLFLFLAAGKFHPITIKVEQRRAAYRLFEAVVLPSLLRK